VIGTSPTTRKASCSGREEVTKYDEKKRRDAAEQRVNVQQAVAD
jgi:hypothetical protein